ncbi:MAG: NrdJb [Xanthomonadales bacterium]|nr:NrdJb [Xanthomonadales bacterium]
MKIERKIVGYSVAKAVENERVVAPAEVPESVPDKPAGAEVIQMHESVERPSTLIGATYKIKSPLVEHALYVTVNDIVLNAGTPHELRRPFEVFINSKNMDHFQWIVALTRIMSAVFRKGGDVTFLVEELKAVFDPRGGYFKAGGVYMPSIVAEIGCVIETHLKTIGLLHDPEMSAEQKRLVAEKRAAYEARAKGDAGSDCATDAAPAASSSREDAAVSAASGEFPPGATMCGKCNTNAVIIMDGCATCLNCGYSKCG